ncbi:MAG: retron Ec67 family RNA-directed DNA polymerase/endonuclease [Candidatus Thiodiazotropha sp. (ex Cardiolucina cf. quadrata)]|nr:retron Ec67 family RNA-directed DNA polymerase/endonuclease [Candidatus Thiodiazotropha sp. (ex Cardiolucina cf. quadrata)]
MSTLNRLKKARNLSALATILGFTPKGVSYVLYKLNPTDKYRTFIIPKKNGGNRTIQAPEPRLALMQGRLAEHLYECVSEIQRKNHHYWHASYGFQKEKTIVGNAAAHTRRRYVFNIDIENFFGSINFGRVRGYFIHDKLFALDPAVATVIAQIACHENSLPQGSPCSPIISNLIGNILDLRLLALARNSRCTYTRYADDLTFSTNLKVFPEGIAIDNGSGRWVEGKKLLKEIERTGFKLNPTKTRMTLNQSRQTVTGLVVNIKPNVNQDYYRLVRAMCNSLFRTGEYHREVIGNVEVLRDLNPLEGMLSYVYFLKARRDRAPKLNRLLAKEGDFKAPYAPIALYRKFLFYKYFISPGTPLIVTEGVSDIIYLECAIHALAKSFPTLAKLVNGKVKRQLSFLRPTITTRDVLNLGHGAAGQVTLIAQYSNNLKKYGHKPLSHPVIVLCDNDGGPKNVFKAAEKKCSTPININTTDAFYYLGDNLYLVKVPEGPTPKPREIEDLFKPVLLAHKIGGKPFDPKKEHGDETAYGKVKFAEEVVKPNTSTIDFSDFIDLLSRIDQCVTHYSTVLIASSAAPAATS